MKRLAALLLLCFTAAYAQAQIANPGFEAVADTLITKPISWGGKPSDGYTIKVVSQEKHAGNKSLLIQGAGTYQPISQVVPTKVDQFKRIAITCYVKTNEVSGSAQLWCQVWNSDGKTISFQNSQMQGAAISGTHEWSKLTLKLTIDTNARKLLLGTFLMGSGSAWFDDFTIEDLPKASQEAAKELAKFGREINGIVQRNAIYADSINWQSTAKGIDELIASGLTAEESPAIVDYVISKLRMAGDKHSLYQSKATAQGYAQRNSVTEQPIARLLPGSIGYISVPAFASTSDTASVNFATRIQNLIKELDTRQDIKGWVVDLRQNGGGNMYPMIAGLGPLIGEGTLGYFVSPKAKGGPSTTWTYHKGSAGVNGRKIVTVKNPYTLRSPDSKIAVLTGGGTGSSGEMTTLCFVGKPNARLFGAPTAGYITANQGFKLSTGAYLYLATGYAADRNQKKYLVNIPPDVPVADSRDKGADAVLDTGASWLKQ